MNPSKLIDHTLLKPPIKKTDIEKLCKEAMHYSFYSVCIPPCYVSLAKKILHNTDIKVCTVIGFPFGYSTTHVKVLESRNAVARGADELDIVLNTGYLKEHADSLIIKELSSIVTLSPYILKKIIIETAMLTQEEKKQVAVMVKQSGADFIKTSTGFAGQGATPEDIEFLKEVTCGTLKIKASGDIRDIETVMQMVDAGASRIGTSAGVAIMKEYEVMSKEK